MTDQADPDDKAIRILLEALTTISYLKGGDGRASAIAEYALDRYGKIIREAEAGRRPDGGAVSPIREWPAAKPGFSGGYSEANRSQHRRRYERRHVNCGPPAGCVERRGRWPGNQKI